MDNSEISKEIVVAVIRSGRYVDKSDNSPDDIAKDVSQIYKDILESLNS